MSSLISNLPNDMTQGITLNYQHIDLFTILDDNEKSEKDKKAKL